MKFPRKAGRRAKGKQCEVIPWEGLTIKDIKKLVGNAMESAKVKHPEMRVVKFNHW